jgi:transcriptional regulator with XRE-family HTH domain
MTFSGSLREERKRLGFSQTELAGLLEVSFEAISKWERGISEPPKIAQEGALARLRQMRKREPK